MELNDVSDIPDGFIVLPEFIDSNEESELSEFLKFEEAKSRKRNYYYNLK